MADMQTSSDTVEVLRSSITKMSASTVGGEVGQAVAAVRELLEAICEGDSVRLEAALVKVTPHSTKTELFEEIGKLARRVHSSLSEFEVDMGPRISAFVDSGIPRAAGQLNAVIELTDEAAHKVMALVEQQSQALCEQNDIIESMIARFNAPAFAPMQVQLEQLRQQNNKARALSKDVLMAQGFQDISGQIIKRVISVVTDVESSLVALVRMFGLPKEDETQPKAETKPDQTCSQDDVNDLLASMGF